MEREREGDFLDRVPLKEPREEVSDTEVEGEELLVIDMEGEEDRDCDAVGLTDDETLWVSERLIESLLVGSSEEDPRDHDCEGV